MNLLLLEPDELGSDGLARVPGRRGRHLVRVLGVEPGARVRAGVIGGPAGTAEVTAVAGETVELRFEPVARAAPPPAPADLMLALPRPKALRRILRLAATMGVGRLDLVNAWRVEKSYFGSPTLEPAAVRRELVLGAEQGGTTRLPEVEVHRLLMPFLSSLGEGADDGRARLLAHPGAAEPIEAAAAVTAGEGRPLLAVGPEGGWIERELGSLRGLGFRPVRLGPWTLPTEAAVAVALGQLALMARMPRVR